MQARKDDRSLGELFGDLARDMGVLVRQEIGLASAEMTQKATRVGQHLAVLAIGGLVAYAGALAIIAAIIIWLGEVGLDWWLSALLVGLVVAIIGGLMIQRGINALKRVDPVPHETIQTLKEDGQWAKEQIN